jgi:hypothetical protein
MVRNHHLAKSISDAAGQRCGPSWRPRQHAPGVRCSRSRPPPPPRTAVGCYPTAAAVHSVSPRACRCVPTPPHLSVLWAGARPRRERGAAHAPGRPGPAPTWPVGASVA